MLAPRTWRHPPDGYTQVMLHRPRIRHCRADATCVVVKAHAFEERALAVEMESGHGVVADRVNADGRIHGVEHGVVVVDPDFGPIERGRIG